MGTWKYAMIKVAEACLEIATDLFPVTVGAYRRIRNEE